MKRIQTIILFSLISLSAYATTWPVTVANFAFSPSTVNAVVGDIIQFNWSNGGHTTTCGAALPGTSHPAGAADWDDSLHLGSITFSYTLTVAGNYVYGCKIHWPFMQATINVSGATPVKLGDFNVVNKNNGALLNWKTFSETNTNYFSIRRSNDGNHFAETGRVMAAGNSNLPLSYQYTDNELPAANRYLYYELATVDKDGTESLSEIKLIKNNRAIPRLITRLNPNPIIKPAQLMIEFNADNNGEMDVRVFNAAGKMVLRNKLAAFYGLNIAHLHVCDLAKGVYTLQFVLSGIKETKSIIVQ